MTNSIDQSSSESTEPSRRRKWWGFTFLAFSLLVIALDLSIADVTLPSIVRDLGISADSASLIITVYMVVAASFMVLMGRVSDLVGAKKAFLVGAVLFGIGSAITGIANDLGMLMAGRSMQGLVMAIAIPASMSLLNHEFPDGRERVLAFSIWTAVIGSAMALGPMIGGLLSTYFSWRWAFWMNVPIMIVGIIGVYYLVRPIGRGERTGKFDILGSLLLVVGLALVVFGLQEAPSLGWWTAKSDYVLNGAISWPFTISPVPIVVLLGILLLVLFARYEIRLNRKGRDSVLAFSLFRVPSFTWGTSAAAAMTAGIFGLLLLIPLYAQFVLDQNPLGAGVILAPLGVGMALGGPVVARFEVSPVRAALICLIIQPIATLTLIPLISAGGEGWWLAPALLVDGFAWGAAFSLLVSMLLADIPKELSGVASGTQVAARLLAGAFAGALLTGLVLGSVGAKVQDISEKDLTSTQQEEITQLYEFQNELVPPTTSSGQTASEAREIEIFDQIIEEVKEDMATGLRLAIGLAAVFCGTGVIFGLGLRRQEKREAKDRETEPT